FRSRLCDDFARDGGNRVAVGVDAGRHPTPQEILVEAVGRLARREPVRITFGEPVAAAIGGVDLVGEEDLPVTIAPELVFSVDQDEAAPGRDVAPAGE